MTFMPLTLLLFCCRYVGGVHLPLARDFLRRLYGRVRLHGAARTAWDHVPAHPARLSVRSVGSGLHGQVRSGQIREVTESPAGPSYRSLLGRLVRSGQCSPGQTGQVRGSTAFRSVCQVRSGQVSGAQVRQVRSEEAQHHLRVRLARLTVRSVCQVRSGQGTYMSGRIRLSRRAFKLAPNPGPRSVHLFKAGIT